MKKGSEHHIAKAGEKTRFKKGQSGNPEGGKKLSPELLAIKPFTTSELKRKIARVFSMTVDELEELQHSKLESSLDVLLASTMMSAIQRGDIFKAEMLFLRSLGKVKEQIQVERPKPTIIKRTDGTFVELGTTISDETENEEIIDAE